MPSRVRSIVSGRLCLAIASVLLHGCTYNYGVRSDDRNILVTCRYADCHRDKHQFETPLFRQRNDTTLGHGSVELELQHLQRPISQEHLGFVSTLELESFDSLVTIDVASVVIEHRRLDGSVITPLRIEVDTTRQCATCDFYLRRVRVRYFYADDVPKRITERVSVDLLVRGTRWPIRAHFRDLRYRLHYTFWTVMMSV